MKPCMKRYIVHSLGTADRFVPHTEVRCASSVPDSGTPGSRFSEEILANSLLRVAKGTEEPDLPFTLLREETCQRGSNSNETFSFQGRRRDCILRSGWIDRAGRTQAHYSHL